MSFNVSIIGASGYTGGELLRILKNHPEADIIGVYGKNTVGKNVTELHPNLNEIVNLTIEEQEPQKIGRESDLVFTATPHGVAMEYVPTILEEGAKVVDLSADYRLDDIQIYKEYYQEHKSPDLEAVYGLPEIYREEIKNSNLVANPGCYPTAAILSLAPLLRKNIIEHDPIIVDSKSGTSGAGAKPSEKLHHPTCAENLRAYKVTNHRHSPEINQEVKKLAGEKAKVHFTPHLIPIIRGILSTSYVFLKEDKNQDEIAKIYQEFYKEEPFIRISEPLPHTNAVRGSNYCDIGIRVSEKSKRATLISVIDNLVKGASGQAVQNMNIMLGLDENSGLKDIGLRP